MGINAKYGYDSKKIARFGKLFPTIDFSINESLSADNYRTRDSKSIVGEFQIGGKSYNVTFQELRRILETAESALEVVHKSYKIGRLGRL